MSHKIEAKNYEPPRMGLFLLQFLIALLLLFLCALLVFANSQRRGICPFSP